MNVQACKQCGILFNWSGYGECLCSTCAKSDDAQFVVVRDYIRDHKNATAAEVTKETGVPIALIEKWLKSERLLQENNIGLKCAKCGKPISVGRICKDCKMELATGFAKAGLSIKKKQNEIEMLKADKGMRFIGRENQVH